MSDIIIGALIGSLATVTGSLLTFLMQRQNKKLLALEKRVERYRTEIRARQAQEEIAAQWIFELGQASSKLAAKRILRDKTENENGLRPFIGPAEIA